MKFDFSPQQVLALYDLLLAHNDSGHLVPLQTLLRAHIVAKLSDKQPDEDLKRLDDLATKLQARWDQKNSGEEKLSSDVAVGTPSSICSRKTTCLT